MPLRVSTGVLLGVLLLGGCARTELTGMRNPAVPPDASFSRILVYLPLDDLKLRQVVENEFVRAARGETYMPAHRFLFPGVEHSAEDIQDVLEEYDVEAVLILSLEEEGSSSVRVPARSRTRCESLWDCSQIITETTGGYAVGKPWAFFHSELLDVRSGEVVWIATAQTNGTTLSDSEDLLRSFAQESVKKLREAGFAR